MYWGFRYEEAGASDTVCTRWFKTASFPQIHVLFYQKDVLYLRAWTNTEGKLLVAGQKHPGRVKSQLSEKQLRRTGRDRSTSLALVKVSVPGLHCSVLNFAVWPCMNLTEDRERPAAVGQ